MSFVRGMGGAPNPIQTVSKNALFVWSKKTSFFFFSQVKQFRAKSEPKKELWQNLADQTMAETNPTLYSRLVKSLFSLDPA